MTTKAIARNTLLTLYFFKSMGGLAYCIWLIAASR